jgi:hypothetical protein
VTGRADRESRIARLLVVLAVLSVNVTPLVLVVLGDGEPGRFGVVMSLAMLASIACCMTAVWLLARGRGARYPLLWSLFGILGPAGLLMLAGVMIIRIWVREARAALRARHAVHGG